MVHRVIVTPDADAAIDRMAGKTATPPEQIRLSPNVLIGTADEIVELLLERRDRYGISYPVFAAADLDGLQPVVEKLHGS